MALSLLFQNIHTLVSCDGDDRVLHGVNLLARGGEIVYIGPEAQAADEVVDASAMAVYPGLVNTHHHLYQTFSRNIPALQNLELFDWLKASYQIWKNLDEEVVYYSSLTGLGELLKCGCTTCADHHYVFPRGAHGITAAQFRAAETLGIRLHAARGSMDRSEKDGGLPPDSVVQSIDEILRDGEEAVRRFHDPARFSMRQVMLAPCSPFSVSADLMRESARQARALGVRLHTHLAETRDEERFTMETVGVRPLAYMQQLGWLGSDVWFAHGIHFNDQELRLLAETQTGVAHCPISNMKLSSGVARIPEMLALGVPAGLAVDGSSSNDGSNLLEELRVGYLLHRLASSKAAPSGYDMLKLATQGSARLLGRDDLGSLEVGKAADWFSIRLDGIETNGATQDPAALLGTVGHKGSVDCTVVNGQMAVRGGVLQNVEEAQLVAESRPVLHRFLAN